MSKFNLEFPDSPARLISPASNKKPITTSEWAPPGHSAVHVNEELICRLWHERYLRFPLYTTDGRPLAIIYPGRWSAGLGPDFQGALISLAGGALLAGDIEVHQRASEWWLHGHDGDPRYAGVILHVVLALDTEQTVRQPNGEIVPTLVIGDYLIAPLPMLAEKPPAHPLPALMDQPCLAVNRQLTLPELFLIIEEAGDRRFATRLARFESAFTVEEPVQTLYRGILDALGYSRNRVPFCDLASLLPAERLATLLGRRDEAARREILTALFLGAAGLLPDQDSAGGAPGDYEATEESISLLAIWNLYRPGLAIKPLSPADWQFARLRPANYPQRRLVAAAVLFARFLAGDSSFFIESCISLLNEDDRATALRAAFTIAPLPASFWSDRFDFGRGRLNTNPALIGVDRAGEIIVNVVLPFLAAYADFYDDDALAKRVRQTYANSPATAGNDVTRRVTLQLLGAGRPARERHQLVATARRQQGLLEMYHELCKHVRCYECAVLRGMAGPPETTNA